MPPASGNPPSRVMMQGTPRCRASIAVRPKSSRVFGGTTIQRAFLIRSVFVASSTKPSTRMPATPAFESRVRSGFAAGRSPIKTSGHCSRSIFAMRISIEQRVDPFVRNPTADESKTAPLVRRSPAFGQFRNWSRLSGSRSACAAAPRCPRQTASYTSVRPRNAPPAATADDGAINSRVM